MANPDPQWEEQVVASVTTMDGEDFDVSGLRNHKADKLVCYKHTQAVITTGELPRSDSDILLKHSQPSEVATA